MSLQAVDISFRYGPRFGVADISLDVPDGTCLGIIGANGSGKTTLLRVLAGLLRPSSGRIVLDDEPLEAYSSGRRARHLAYVPQSYQPAFAFTVEQTVLMGRMPHGVGYGGFEAEDDRRYADEAIETMGLDQLRHEPVTKLSGGELQRVMIARALAQTTRNILLDEPTAHLDIAYQQETMNRLRERIDASGTAAIATVHDLNLAAMYCDRLVALRGGRVVCTGRPEEVLTRSVLHDVFGVHLEVQPGVYGTAPLVRFPSVSEGHDAR